MSSHHPKREMIPIRIDTYTFRWDGKHLEVMDGFMEGTHHPKWHTASHENTPDHILGRAIEQVRDIESSRKWQR